MIWVVIAWLVMVAVFLECAHRAPTIEDHEGETLT